MLEIVILAAGKGTRMRSDKPKVLHTLAAKPFLFHVLDRALELKADKIHVVVGHGAQMVKDAVNASTAYQGLEITYVAQTEQLGTGHAVQQAFPHLGDTGKTLILYGDVPLTSTQTLQTLLDGFDDEQMGLLTVNFDDPTGYGRIIRDSENRITGIVEQKDASPEQLAIKEVNSGIMAVNNAHLAHWLPSLSNDNAQQEYYLTDIIAMAASEAVEVKGTQPSSTNGKFWVSTTASNKRNLSVSISRIRPIV